MLKSMLFLPVALAGLVVLALGGPAAAWVPLLVIGLVGTVALSAAGARHDDELRREATGQGPSEAGPGDPGRRAS